MSTYFTYTSSVEVAINVLAAGTDTLGVRFGVKDGGWEFEWDIETMRKEMKLGNEEPSTPEVARKFLYSKLPDKYLPKIVLNVRKMKEGADWLLEKHNKVMNLLMDEKANQITKKKLIRFMKEYYPHLQIENLSKAEIVELLRNV